MKPTISIVVLLAASLGVGIYLSPVHDDAGSQIPDPGSANEASPLSSDGGGESVGFDLEQRGIQPAVTPDGIVTHVVPSIVTRPKAHYTAAPVEQQQRIRPTDIPLVGKGGQGLGFPAPVATSESPRRQTTPMEKPQATTRPPAPSETGAPQPPASRAPALDLSFDAADFVNNSSLTGFVFIPPDPIGAAGPDHVVNVVNVAIQFFQKDGTLDANLSLRDFFAGLSPTTYTFDPKVIYDQYAERFVVVTLEKTNSPETSRIFVAVSDDADPNGAWTVTAIDAYMVIGSQTRWADYPGFAIDEEAVYITANMFNFPGTNLGGVRLWILDKGLGSSGFYDGGPASVSVFNPYAGGGSGSTTQPAHVFGTAPNSAFGTFLVSYSGLTDGLNEYLQVTRLDNPLGTPSFSQNFYNLGNLETNLSELPGAPQNGDSRLINTNDRRALHSVWRDDSLWIVATVALPDVLGPEETAAYWWQMDTSVLGSLSVNDQGSILGEDIASGTYTFFPSIAVTSGGDVGIGFSASAPSIYAGSYYTTVEATALAAPNTGTQVLRAGLAPYYRVLNGTRNRWGDYSGVALDPVDECFWVYNEHAITQGTPTGSPPQTGRWGTAFGRVCTCDQTLALTQGLWHQVSLACNTGQVQTAAALFGDDLGGTYGTDWGMYGWDATAATYNFLAETAPLAPGQSYWIATHQASQSVRIKGSRPPVFEIPLVDDPAGRFNMVGHPYNYDVCWEDVAVIDSDDSVLTLAQADPGNACQNPNPLANGCRMSRIAHKWNGNTYDAFNGITPNERGTLVAWDGFWVQAFKPGIRLQVPAQPGNCGTPAAPEPGKSPSNRGTRGASRSARPGGWSINLTASSGDMRANGSFGHLLGAESGYDLHDLPQLSPFGTTFLSLVFPQPEWQERAGDYATDYHPLRRTPRRDRWQFEVRTSAIGEVITLSWESPRGPLKRSILVDLQTGHRQRIGPGETYSYTADAESRAFAWIVRK